MLVKPTRVVDQQGRKLRLSTSRAYEVLGIEADWYRLLNDDQDPVLYDPIDFEIVDDTRPVFWVTSTGDEGELYAYPAEWSAAGFFEDFHDGSVPVRAQFWYDLKRLYPHTGG